MSDRQRIVLDTNVLISAILIPTSSSGKTLEVVLQNALPVISTHTFQELNEKLLLPKFDRYVSISDRRQFLKRFLLVSAFISVDTIITDCRDPKDNKFLELALDASANYLISGDQDLLILNPFRGISILTPQAFLNNFYQE